MLGENRRFIPDYKRLQTKAHGSNRINSVSVLGDCEMFAVSKKNDTKSSIKISTFKNKYHEQFKKQCTPYWQCRSKS